MDDRATPKERAMRGGFVAQRCFDTDVAVTVTVEHLALTSGKAAVGNW